jgi:hypothetical protein
MPRFHSMLAALAVVGALLSGCGGNGRDDHERCSEPSWDACLHLEAEDRWEDRDLDWNEARPNTRLAFECNIEASAPDDIQLTVERSPPFPAPVTPTFRNWPNGRGFSVRFDAGPHTGAPPALHIHAPGGVHRPPLRMRSPRRRLHHAGARGPLTGAERPPPSVPSPASCWASPGWATACFRTAHRRTSSRSP